MKRCRLPFFRHRPPKGIIGEWSVELQGYVSHCRWCGVEIVAQDYNA